MLITAADKPKKITKSTQGRIGEANSFFILFLKYFVLFADFCGFFFCFLTCFEGGAEANKGTLMELKRVIHKR